MAGSTQKPRKSMMFRCVRGAAWHIVCALMATAPAVAQEEGAIDGGTATVEPAEPAPEEEAPELASELSEPTLAPRPQPVARPRPPVRPRGYRMPRETVRRPLTLPQGVLSFDSTMALSAGPVAFGSRLYTSGFFAVAAGVLDDLEVGTMPFGVSFGFFNVAMHDPFVYARGRVLSGDVQIAFRGGFTLPIAGQLPSSQMELAAELAWRFGPDLRLDVALEYDLLFSDPLHQRVGIPVTFTGQIGIHAIRVTAGFFVFNDFDDYDIPLLLGYVVSFRGYQGPLGEWAFEGGFTDLPHGDDNWTIRSRVTFFAYL